jgi:SAM-dependent methyltransferase
VPRSNAKEHWKVDVPIEEFYRKKDPWNLRGDKEERRKAERIYNAMKKHYGWGLDIGCGEGLFTKLYAEKCDTMLGFDISFTAVGRARKAGIHCFQCDIRDDLYWPNQFDVILCNEVLYYIPPEDLPKVVKNIYGLLRPGGDLIISVGHYFTKTDIEKLFDKIEFNRFCLFDFKGDDCIIMGGSYVPDEKV